jgi:hypothetical protein
VSIEGLEMRVPLGDDDFWMRIQQGAQDSGQEMRDVGGGTFDPFRYVSGQVSYSPEPLSGNIAFDKWEWHLVDEAVLKRPEAAFVHIGTYLTWAIRRDLVRKDRFRLPALNAVRAGSELGSSLRDDCDGRLTADLFSADGAQFTRWYYRVRGPEPTYLGDWQATFGEAADRYEVPDTWETYSAIEKLLDARFETWRSSHPA